MIRLLYVDDEEYLLEIGKEYLESFGDFSVTTTVSALNGLADLKCGAYDAVISDYQMPGMNGIDLLKMVRKEVGSIPFILFTGKGREEVVIEAINNGADFYIQKGGDAKSQFAELAHKIRHAVIRAKAQEDLRAANLDLMEKENLFRELFNLVPVYCTVTDEHGRYILVNKSFEEASGFKSAEVIGKTSFELGLANPENYKEILEKMTETGKIDHLESIAYTKDGKMRKVLVSSRYTVINSSPHIITMVIDITDNIRFLFG